MTWKTGCIKRQGAGRPCSFDTCLPSSYRKAAPHSQKSPSGGGMDRVWGEWHHWEMSHTPGGITRWRPPLSEGQWWCPSWVLQCSSNMLRGGRQQMGRFLMERHSGGGKLPHPTPPHPAPLWLWPGGKGGKTEADILLVRTGVQAGSNSDREREIEANIMRASPAGCQAVSSCHHNLNAVQFVTREKDKVLEQAWRDMRDHRWWSEISVMFIKSNCETAWFTGVCEPFYSW